MKKDDERMSDSVCGKLIQTISEMVEAMKQMEQIIYDQRRDIEQLTQMNFTINSSEIFKDKDRDDAGSH